MLLSCFVKKVTKEDDEGEEDSDFLLPPPPPLKTVCLTASYINIRFLICLGRGTLTQDGKYNSGGLFRFILCGLVSLYHLE